jgi:hypothetical protein
MVPIHDTDLAEERWSKAEWENYELWEKIELRLKRQKRLWIVATGIAFVALSAVPIVMDRWPKWTTRSLSRQLAQVINQVKREAISNRSAFRIRFVGDGNIDYVVEKLSSCTAAEGEKVRASSLGEGVKSSQYTWVSPNRGSELQVPGLVTDFCYDYLVGNGAILQGNPVVGFGIIPVNDLTEKRLDRLSLLLLSGSSAEISFD